MAAIEAAMRSGLLMLASWFQAHHPAPNDKPATAALMKGAKSSRGSITLFAPFSVVS
jgi:hypothetical protein